MVSIRVFVYNQSLIGHWIGILAPFHQIRQWVTDIRNWIAFLRHIQSAGLILKIPFRKHLEKYRKLEFKGIATGDNSVGQQLLWTYTVVVIKKLCLTAR